MRSHFLLESKRPLQVWLAAYSRRTLPQLRLEASSAGPDQSINGQQFLRQHHFFPWSRPPYRLLQLPASALVKGPFLRDRGDSPYPAAPLDSRPCQTSLTYFCNFPSRCRTPSILPASPSDNRASAISLLLVPMTTAQRMARPAGRGPAALSPSYDSVTPCHPSDNAHRHFQGFFDAEVQTVGAQPLPFRGGSEEGRCHTAPPVCPWKYLVQHRTLISPPFMQCSKACKWTRLIPKPCSVLSYRPDLVDTGR